MRNNLKPTVWGPTAWDFLDQCLFAYDESSREAYLQLMHLLPQILPCELCRHHSAKFIRENPPDCQDDLKEWLRMFRLDIAQRKTRSRENARAGGWKLTLFLLILVIALGAVAYAHRN